MEIETRFILPSEIIKEGSTLDVTVGFKPEAAQQVDP